MDSYHKCEWSRYHHLDALRSFALLLGVLWHAAESFGGRNSYWAFVDYSANDLLVWFRFGCHSFRLELFFLLAGFFARLMLISRVESAFIWNRFRRILVPLVVGWVLLYPVVVLIWLWGWSLSNQLEDFGVPQITQYHSIWYQWWYLCLARPVLHKFGLIHLWFLYQLLVIYLILLGIRRFAGKLNSKSKLMKRLDQGFAKMSSWSGALFCFSIGGIPIMLLMRNWTVDTPNQPLIPELPTTLLFGVCFLVGWFLHRQPTLLDCFGRNWWWHLEIAFVLWLLFGIYGKYEYQVLAALSQKMTRWEYIWSRLVYMSAYSCMMWAFVLGLLGFFTRFFQRPSIWLRYLNDSSYWIYLIHFPIVVSLQVLLGPIAAPWLLKYIAINAMAFLLLFASYHYLVRNTFIGIQLNGRRYPLKWPWQAKKDENVCRRRMAKTS
jgi:peptidoglycan/LPS O-acetylase OafA/YrhL